MISYVRLGILAGLFIAGLLLGWGYEHRNLVAFKAEVETVAREQEAKVISVQKQQELVNKGIENEYQAKLSALKSVYGGVRLPSSGSMPSIPQSTIGIDGKATNLELACAYTTQQLVSLQDWIRESVVLK